MARVDKDVLLSACKTGALDKILKYKGLNLQVRYSVTPNSTSLHIAAGYVLELTFCCYLQAFRNLLLVHMNELLSSHVFTESFKKLHCQPFTNL